MQHDVETMQRHVAVPRSVALKAGTRRRELPSAPPGLGVALIMALSLRLVLSAMAAWLLSWHAPAETAVVRAQYLGLAPLHDLLLAPWQRFDAFWYLRIALHGYSASDGSTVYYPLYPLLIRAVSVPFGGNTMLAALLVSNLCFVGVLVTLYNLVAPRYGAAAARRTLLLLCVFPTAVFLLGAYTEALFLLLTIGSSVALDRDRPLLAGVLGFLAALTRLQGIVLVLPLLWAAWAGIRKPVSTGAWHDTQAEATSPSFPYVCMYLLKYVIAWTIHLIPLTPFACKQAKGESEEFLRGLHPRTPTFSGGHELRWIAGMWRTWRYWLAAPLPLLGTALFMLYVRLVVHGGSVTAVYARQVHQQLDLPWATLASYWSALAAHHWQIFSYATGNWVDALNLLLALGMLAIVVPARRLLGTPLWLYALATWAATLCIHQSTARYMLTVFPALIVLAVRLPTRPTTRLALLLGTPLMLFIAAEFTLWSFVG